MGKVYRWTGLSWKDETPSRIVEVMITAISMFLVWGVVEIGINLAALVYSFIKQCS